MTARDEIRSRLAGYGLVLVLVVASVLVQMTATGPGAARFATIVLQAATLVAAVWTTSPPRTGVRVAAGAAMLVVVATVIVWIAHGEVPKTSAAIVNGLLVGVAPMVLAGGLYRDIRRERAVTVRTLAGVISIYLLIGMFFSFLYAVIGAVEPDALFAGRDESTPAEQLYFSYVTMSTVGYGDFSPLGGAARTLAVAEMLLGQIYLVTVVALIVGNLGRPPPRQR